MISLLGRRERARSSRRWLAPEVVQTSAMDCGPASLKCLLEGFHIPVSYGRLREACQTDLDGTSIDTMESVANQLGVVAEQVMIPMDHIFLKDSQVLPAMVVVRHADGATHFVVVWRRHGNWLQVMDPAAGRRWVSCARFSDEILRHEMSVPADDWRAWAHSADFLSPLEERLKALGVRGEVLDEIIEGALSDPGWFELAVLDASVRLVQSVVNSGGIGKGRHAVKLLLSLVEQTCASPHDIYRIIPPAYWSVAPDPDSVELGEVHLKLTGAVLVKVTEARQDSRVESSTPDTGKAPLSQELRAALSEKTVRPLQIIWNLLKADGLLSPLALVGAMVVSAGAVVLETLLFRGILDIASVLHLGTQRMGAILALLTFATLLLLIEIPIFTESLRMGRQLETRLRMALLAKLPKLSDRYFQSRPVSDMADRSHSINQTRLLPSLGVQLLQSLFLLIFTLIGIAYLSPASAPIELLIGALALIIPGLIQPLINERDLRVRNHAAALTGFYLDALIGIVPIRTHGAEKAVLRQHEGLLVEWARSARGLVRFTIASNGVQSLVCFALAGYLLIHHFAASGGISGGDLLLVYWTLKLPDIGGSVSGIVHQYPAQRNVLLRLVEPLNTPDAVQAEKHVADAEPHADVREATSRVEWQGRIDLQIAPAATRTAGVDLRIQGGSIVAAGHTILRDIDVHIAPGEHVAIIGSSGAGKSTLVGLLLGWHRLATGSVWVDGAPLDASAQETLRRRTAWVDPGIQIWNQSFVDNLRYASEDAALDSVGRAIQSAELRDVLRKLPKGLQSHLGEGGAMLSGGEGQRVRLGRALLQQNARLTLLDEPFRGMDREQRRTLLADARQWWSDATLLCVTHDVSETLSFPRVLVVDEGRIVEDGSPQELAVSLSRYRELLLAERVLRNQLWQGRHWRRIRIENGSVEVPQTIGGHPDNHQQGLG